MKALIRLTVAMFILSTLHLSAATLYVSLESTNPVPPYATWETAATNIQHAVDAAAARDTVLVTNGVYAVGERDASVLDTNQQPPQLVSMGLSRVVVTNSIKLESVNGPLVTTIWGGQLTNEFGDVTNTLRCVFLGTNAMLSGFTLANGLASYGGGLYCESATAVVSDCVLTGNGAWGVEEGGYGGGAYGGTLNNCLLTGNSAHGSMQWGPATGGGAYGGTLNNCTLDGNQADGGMLGAAGGGAYMCRLNNCTLRRNVVIGCGTTFGGGACFCTLNNCTLSDNYATGQAYRYGAGAYGSTLNNCTLSGNRYDGVYDSTLNNCIVYYHHDANYDTSSTLNYCCTTPMPTNGVGNITNAPLFVDFYHGNLRPDSPCIDAGTNLTGVISTDILGLPRPMDGNNDGVARFDMGAHEFNPYRFAPTLHLSASGLQFTVCGEPGRSVRIERSRDLLNWEFAGQVPIPIGGQTLIDPAATSESRLFYRAIRVP
jgi:hypothetical protein